MRPPSSMDRMKWGSVAGDEPVVVGSVEVLKWGKGPEGPLELGCTGECAPGEKN